MKRVELYFDFSCPYAYLAHTQIDAFVARTKAEVIWKPMLLGGVFRAIGTPDVPATAMSSAKARLNALDMHRWADHFGVPLVMPPTHPNRTVLALRAALASGPNLERASRALFRAYWAEGEDLSRPEVVRAALDSAGLDGAALVARADDQAIKDDLRARTDEAIAKGVFGEPAFVVGDELFWGQDRLAFVERAVTGKLPEAPSFGLAKPGTTLDFFFDTSSPFAYLASTQVEAIARRTGARLVWKPFLLGALFKEIGTPNVPLLAMPEPKRRHSGADLMRWAEALGVPLNFPTRFPMNTVKAQRMILQATPDPAPLIHALFRALWVDDRDLSDDATLIEIARSIDLDGEALVRGTQRDDVKAMLKAATDDAREAGLCGAPTCRVNGMIFWGQDRLMFVEKALSGWVPMCDKLA
jgi:2-hydroxychromene-2-carboxylate isomerase